MNNNIDLVVNKVSDVLRSSLPYSDFESVCIYNMFLKYILDNEIMPYDKTTFALQRMYDRGEINEDAIIDTSILLEEKFKFPKNSLVNIASMIIKFNAENRLLSRISNLINELDFSENGPEIVESIVNRIYMTSSNFGRLVGEVVSSKSLSLVIKEILQVRDDDSYADFMYGYGLSSLEITKEHHCIITGFELQGSAVAVAKMLLILSGKDYAEIHYGDLLETKIPENKYSKISVVNPLGVRVRELNNQTVGLFDKYNIPLKPCMLESIVILKAIDSMNNNGTAVITVTPSFLFTTTLVETNVRKLLVEKYLHSIIQLPGLYYGTNVTTVALVLKKGVHSDEVLMIDAISNKFFEFSKKFNKGITELTSSGIDKIIELFNNGRSENGLSCTTAKEAIKNNDYSLSLSKYIVFENENKRLTNKEIDEKLKDLYEKLKNVMEGLL